MIRQCIGARRWGGLVTEDLVLYHNVLYCGDDFPFHLISFNHEHDLPGSLTLLKRHSQFNKATLPGPPSGLPVELKLSLGPLTSKNSKTILGRKVIPTLRIRLSKVVK